MTPKIGGGQVTPEIGGGQVTPKIDGGQDPYLAPDHLLSSVVVKTDSWLEAVIKAS